MVTAMSSIWHEGNEVCIAIIFNPNNPQVPYENMNSLWYICVLLPMKIKNVVYIIYVKMYI